MPSTMEKVAVVAPMPSASISTALIENPGDLRTWRDAYCNSLRTVSIVISRRRLTYISNAVYST
jgi:hypothetical protein